MIFEYTTNNVKEAANLKNALWKLIFLVFSSEDLDTKFLALSVIIKYSATTAASTTLSSNLKQVSNIHVSMPSKRPHNFRKHKLTSTDTAYPTDFGRGQSTPSLKRFFMIMKLSNTHRLNLSRAGWQGYQLMVNIY